MIREVVAYSLLASDHFGAVCLSCGHIKQLELSCGHKKPLSGSLIDEAVARAMKERVTLTTDCVECDAAAVICPECDPPGSGQECRGGPCGTCKGTGRIHSTADNGPEAVAIITALEGKIAGLEDLLDVDRYKVALGVQAISKAVQSRQWLSQPGRGSYAYDDERYQQEFGQALDEISAALAPLQTIAQDWSNCPRDPLRVEANRAAAVAQHPREGTETADGCRHDSAGKTHARMPLAYGSAKLEICRGCGAFRYDLHGWSDWRPKEQLAFALIEDEER